MFIPLGLAKRYGMAYHPFLYLILEQIRSRFPFGGFGWLRLAYSQADAPYRWLAAIGGAGALSAIVLSIAFTLFLVISGKRDGFHLSFLAPLLPLLLIFLPLNIANVGSIKTLMVQGGVPQLGLDFNSRATAVFFNHLRESKKALLEAKPIDLILWPENAVDVDPFTSPKITSALNTLPAPLIIGAVIRQGGKLENASILWSADSQSIYIKEHLTPFGEYIPWRAIARRVSPLVDNVQDFSPGMKPMVFTVKKAKIAPIICFELIDDAVVRAAARRSNLIVVQTNSATFGKSAQSAQQLSITRVRAIENARNILSVSTSGISAVIDYKGNVDKESQLNQSTHIYAEASLINTQTPANKAGGWALIATLFWLLLFTRLHPFRGK